MDNILNARIKLKYDSLTNWNNSTFKPLAGEVCIAYIATNSSIGGGAEGTQTNQPRAIGIKVGDGSHTFLELPWIQAVAADVYNWAKASVKPSYNASEIAATERNGTENASNVQAILTTLQNSIASLTNLAGAMHFIGITSTTLTDGATTSTLTPKTTGSLLKTTGFESGDVVLYDDDITIGKEFLWTGSAWELLGDEGSYAVKGSITNNDIANNAAIAQTKIAGSTVNTTLVDDLSLLAPKASPTFTGTVTIPVTPTSNTDAASKKYVDDTAAASNTTYTFAEGDADGQIKITSSTNGVAGTPVNVKPKNLKTIATSASIYDVNEINISTSTASNGQKFFILDCGDADYFIDDASTT